MPIGWLKRAVPVGPPVPSTKPGVGFPPPTWLWPQSLHQLFESGCYPGRRQKDFQNRTIAQTTEIVFGRIVPVQVVVAAAPPATTTTTEQDHHNDNNCSTAGVCTNRKFTADHSSPHRSTGSNRHGSTDDRCNDEHHDYHDYFNHNHRESTDSRNSRNSTGFNPSTVSRKNFRQTKSGEAKAQAGLQNHHQKPQTHSHLLTVQGLAAPGNCDPSGPKNKRRNSSGGSASENCESCESCERATPSHLDLAHLQIELST